MLSSFELISCYPVIQKPDRDAIDSYQVYVRFDSSRKFLIKYFDEITSNGVIKEFNAEEIMFSICFKRNSVSKMLFLSIHSYDYRSCTVVAQNENSLRREDFIGGVHKSFTWLEIDFNNLF